MQPRSLALPLVTLLALSSSCTSEPQAVASPAAAVDEWAHYARDEGGTKYSPLADIDRSNVGNLTVAWTARTGDFPPEMFDRAAHDPEGGGLPTDERSQACGTCHGVDIRFETTPLMVDGTVYVSTPLSRVLALDPATGRERWAFEPDPPLDQEVDWDEDLMSRGVSAWTDVDAPEGAPCRRRLFLATLDARLYALDAADGRPCESFGQRGRVTLTDDLDRFDRQSYLVTSPPAVVNGVVVVGSAIGDNRRVDVEPGVVRAFDARTGALRWRFDPIPRSPDHAAWSDWSPEAARMTGAANVWSLISADPSRDLVFLPTGSAAPDFYGGERPGRNDFANSVVALRAGTGELVWSYQVVHHDLWDYDVASQPVLVTLDVDGVARDGVAIGTKMGHVFVVDRDTGEPLLPVEERPVPASDVPGEQAWPTQPFPVHTPPLHEMVLTPDSAFGITDEDREFCRAWIASLRNEGVFTPPSLEGTLLWPGFGGGMNWDGMAWDPERRVLVTTVKRLAMFVQLHRRDDFAQARAEGRPGMGFTGQDGTPYGMSRMPLFAPSQVPCSPPPWGKLVALDLEAGRILWERPLGTVPALAEVEGSEGWGSVVFGGPLVTAGGLVFVAAGQDDRIRAFDIDTGELLWEHELPAGGQAAPMTYRVGGRQYVVIAAGGRAGFGSPGDWVVAFALPE